MKSELPPSVEAFEDLLSLFDSNRELPLNVKETGVEHQNGVAVHDINYASQAESRVTAYLLTPPGTGPFAGVIYVHPAPGDRTTFLDETVRLAQQGAVCLLIDAPWAQGEAWGQILGQPDHDRSGFIQFTIDIRRAVDLLTSRPDVDANRIGYVGHSFGALFGGVLSGVEKRIKAFALMAGTGSFTVVMVLNLPFLEGQALEQYAQVMTQIDPLYYVRHAVPLALLFQFGRQDEAFPQDKVRRFAEAGSKPKSVQWYDAGHDLNEQARADRMEWLRTRLDLPGA